MPDFRSAMDTEEEAPSVPGANAVFGNLPPRRGQRVEVDQKALVATGDGNFIYKRFQMTPVGMSLPEDASGAEWEEIGWALKGIDNAISWWIGDWALFAMHHWNWTAAQVAETFDYTPETIETYAWICGGIPGSIRNRAVFFSHHRSVAKMNEPMQRAWLDYAAFFIQQRRLKVAEFKQDITAVDLKGDDEKLYWIEQAVARNARLSEMDELTPPALLPPGGLSPVVKRGKSGANRAWKTLLDYTAGKIDPGWEKIAQDIDEAERWLKALRESRR